MRKETLPVLAALAMAFATLPARAANPVVTSTIKGLGVESTDGSGGTTEVVTITLDAALPATTGCPAGNAGFEFEAGSVNDAQTRKNMLAVLLAARASGAPVTIVYDGTGKFCGAFGFAVPLAISL